MSAREPEGARGQGQGPGQAQGHGPGWTLRFGLLTDPGLARERNEDACAVYVPWQGERAPARADALFLVADGMGGHEAGDVASAHVAGALRHWFTSGDAPRGEDNDAFGEALHGVVLRAHDSLLALGEEKGLTRGAGSTLTALCLRGDQLHVAHVGDSRLYRLRDQALVQLTRDHAWVAEQVRAGALSPEEAAHHPQRHMLTQCLGVGRDVQVDLLRFEAVEGDRYLLCSDGLHGPVSDGEILDLMAASRDPQETVRALVDRANQAAGPDNITAVVLHLEAPWEGPHTDPELILPGATDPGTTHPGAVDPGATDPGVGGAGLPGAHEPTGPHRVPASTPSTSTSPSRTWQDRWGGNLPGFLAGAGVMLLVVALVTTLSLGGQDAGASAAGTDAEGAPETPAAPAGPGEGELAPQPEADPAPDPVPDPAPPSGELPGDEATGHAEGTDSNSNAGSGAGTGPGSHEGGRSVDPARGGAPGGAGEPMGSTRQGSPGPPPLRS
jgi:serine/threonine protein phosphatase PrpC